MKWFVSDVFAKTRGCVYWALDRSCTRRFARAWSVCVAFSCEWNVMDICIYMYIYSGFCVERKLSDILKIRPL